MAISAAYAATAYHGNGGVPQQFVLCGKVADRLHDYISINLDIAKGQLIGAIGAGGMNGATGEEKCVPIM